jgi:hypothetical protein
MPNRMWRDTDPITQASDGPILADPPAVTRYLDAVEATVADRLSADAVQHRLDQIKQAAESMPRSADPEWDLLIEELARYGYQVVRSWILILQFANEHDGWLRLLAGQSLTARDADMVASETVARGINSFRSEIMRMRRWSEQRVPELRTIFLVECAWHLPTVCRYWLLKTEQLSSDAQEWLLSTEDTEARAELFEILKGRVHYELVRVAGVLEPAGYTDQEITEIIEVTREVFDVVGESGPATPPADRINSELSDGEGHDAGLDQ